MPGRLLREALERMPPPINHRTGGIYRIVPVDEEFVGGPEAIAAIVECCNQPLIYDLLFAERCAGVPYSESDAAGFLDWCRAGWREGTHFPFVLCDAGGTVAGAMDIKSAERPSAEIGYWLSADHSGVMTNAVRALAMMARHAGYRGLHALVRPENDRSHRVLQRAGFHPAGRAERGGKVYDRYALALG
ncbi:MAG TPA: GNAT family N-acetyltransferase [Candidatus Kapabacteria bacterium]|nr:GNAT family N-acetyltransferase [Candidatus Kapabacteria bacterium]